MSVAPRWLTVARSLALLPALAPGAGCFFTTGLGPSCPADQSLPAGARDSTGATIPTAVAAQCSAPGPEGSACAAPVRCYSSTQSCCGQWVCVANPLPDAGAPAYVWNRQLCEGPLPPPELPCAASA